MFTQKSEELVTNTEELTLKVDENSLTRFIFLTYLALATQCASDHINGIQSDLMYLFELIASNKCVRKQKRFVSLSIVTVRATFIYRSVFSRFIVLEGNCGINAVTFS